MRKWIAGLTATIVGAVALVAAATLTTPDTVSAHHVTLNGSVNCDAGTFKVDADYFGGNQNRIIVIDVGGDRFDGAANDYAPSTVTHTDEGSGDGNFNFSSDRDRFESDGASDRPNFFVLNGAVASLPVTVTATFYGASDDNDLDDTTIPDSDNPLLDTQAVTVNGTTCTPTPTNTPTATATNTPSPTATNTPTATATSTATATNTPEPTDTPTATATATDTPTETPTATSTPEDTATATGDIDVPAVLTPPDTGSGGYKTTETSGIVISTVEIALIVLGVLGTAFIFGSAYVLASARSK